MYANGWRRSSLAVAAVGLVFAGFVATAAPAGAAGDDYPHRGAANCASLFGTYSWCIDENANGSFSSEEQYSPRNFSYRNCTDWVAWRLNGTNGVAFNNGFGGKTWGNANNWDDAARALGYPVNNTPARGAVAQTDAGGFGHVAWVSSVNADGTVTVEEYNRAGTGVYGVRTVAASSFVYIHIKDLSSTPAGSPFGSYDQLSSPSAGQIKARGWSADPNAPSTATKVHIYVGGPAGTAGVEGHEITANGSRPDVATAFGASYGSLHGFDSTFNTAKRGAVQVCAYAINIGAGANTLLGCKTVTVADPNPFGSYDQLSSPSAGQIKLRGWAIDRSTPTAPVQIRVVIGGPLGTKGAEVKTILADRRRDDVASKYSGTGSNHGFDSTLATTKSGKTTVCAYAVNTGVGQTQSLGCRSVNIPK